MRRASLSPGRFRPPTLPAWGISVLSYRARHGPKLKHPSPWSLVLLNQVPLSLHFMTLNAQAVTLFRYKKFSVHIRNLFNTTNGAVPVGNLRSDLFCRSLLSAGGFGFGGGGFQSAGNRPIEFEIELSF